ncbi:cation transporter [Algoriphagus namhaensis]
MLKSTFRISQMDCPSEENLIRTQIQGQFSIKKLEFDIPDRKLVIFHEAFLEEISASLQRLQLGSQLLDSEPTEQTDFAEDQNQKKLLWTVLGINFGFFVLEMSTGLLSRSMGLVADSLDMLADSFVYGISLLAIGGSIAKKKKIASVAGYFQMLLALIGFVEVIRRFLNAERLPDFDTMILISCLALIANVVCLVLLQKSKSKEEAHMQASMIFTSNDVIINLGVILAGLLVHWTDSSKPDLIIGIIVFLLVMQGARRILQLSK